MNRPRISFHSSDPNRTEPIVSSPDHMAYATPSGMYLMLWAKSRRPAHTRAAPTRKDQATLTLLRALGLSTRDYIVFGSGPLAVRDAAWEEAKNVPGGSCAFRALRSVRAWGYSTAQTLPRQPPFAPSGPAQQALG